MTKCEGMENQTEIDFKLEEKPRGKETENTREERARERDDELRRRDAGLGRRKKGKSIRRAGQDQGLNSERLLSMA